MIIIPDVHGRVFWKEVVKNSEDKIIFLGDYVDPYPGENISLTGALDNLSEIIDYKKSNPSKVILLLGNHDFMYMDSEHNKYSCRHDFENEPKITKLLMNNRDLFQMNYSIEIKNKLYIFSHAGILKPWIEKYKNLFGEFPGSLDKINELYKKWDPEFISSLLEISYYRGGWSDFGSMIWSDVREHSVSCEENIYQIFGHTQLKDKPIIEKHFADLDCRRPFFFDEKTGDIKEIPV